MRGLGAYRTILTTPGAARLVAASLAARLSFGLFDLALVLLVERATGSFATARLVVARDRMPGAGRRGPAPPTATNSESRH